MKCISIHPEYVAQILDGEKTEEYRSWSTKYRGDLLIACTKTKTTNPYICAIVTVTDCIEDEDDGIYSFIFENVRVIKPLPVKGQQRIYNVDYTESDIEILDFKDAEYVDKVYQESEKWILIPKK